MEMNHNLLYPEERQSKFSSLALLLGITAESISFICLAILCLFIQGFVTSELASILCYSSIILGSVTVILGAVSLVQENRVKRNMLIIILGLLPALSYSIIDLIEAIFHIAP